MSAEDDPAELRERVEELEDTIAKMLPTRRAVLAGALGAGAGAAGVYTSSHPASAQASGQVGTSSDPVNVEGYDVTADNSITDAAGVTHTGELADLSDTGGGVQNPLTQDLDFAGNDARNVGSFDSETANNVRIAEPGEIQSKLNTVGNLSNVGFGAGQTRGVVKVKPNTIYDPGQTIDVPPGVTLDARYALFEPSSSYDGVFLDNAARCHVYAMNDRSYTGQIVYIDTSESTNGKYQPFQQGGTPYGGAYADITHWGNINNNPPDPNDPTAGGETAVMRDPAGEGIATQHWDVESWQPGTGIHIHTADGGFINTPINANIRGSAQTSLRHTGSDIAAGSTLVNGQVVCGEEYGIRNETNVQYTFTLNGSLWDVTNAAQYAIAGPGVRVNLSNGGKDPTAWPGNGLTDGSTAIQVYKQKAPGIMVYNGAQDSSFLFKFDGGHFQFMEDGTEVIRFQDTRVLLNQILDMGGNRLNNLSQGTSNFGGIVFNNSSGAGFYSDGTDVYVKDSSGSTTQLT